MVLKLTVGGSSPTNHILAEVRFAISMSKLKRAIDDLMKRVTDDLYNISIPVHLSYRLESEIQIPLPCMFFGDNSLSVLHAASGLLLEFTAKDAVDLVNKTLPSVQVGWAEEWQKNRTHTDEIKRVVKPYDWTYTTDYRGTLKPGDTTKVERTQDELDIASLQVQEPILFFDEVILFEDELDDNGGCLCNVKVIRVIDTRIHHKFKDNFLLRECSSRESTYEDLLKIVRGPASLRSADEIWPNVQIKDMYMERITFRDL